MRTGRRIAAAIAAGCTAIAVLPASTLAAAEVQPYQANDFKGFHDVLPPGTNGLITLGQLGGFLTAGTRPAHSDDQLAMYRDLVYATPGLKAEDLGRYYKDASFGVRPEDVASSVSPRDDVTVVRDRQFGVPHIYATTRAGAMFGSGYAAAQDRLFFIDVLRHLGRAQLASFAGGAAGNRSFDESQWSIAPYSEADLQHQIDQFDDLYGAEGRQIQDDLDNYVAGVNTYISEARLDPNKMPGEYAAIGRTQGPDDWKATDIIATASLVGGIFGRGGGGELTQVRFLQAMQARFGAKAGRTLWYQFSGYDDPDAPTTVKKTRFPYQLPPRRVSKGDAVLPDAGTLKDEPVVVTGPAAAPRAAPGLLAFAPAMSNALVISAAKSQSGHPLAVFGPQVAYFNPEILMEQDVHAPTIDARGASFPGVNLYVELGRGRDYSWSATSAGQDITDVFAVPLCDPGGGAPALGSDHYEFHGQCVAMETLERTNAWQPTLADQTAAGTVTLRALRTKLGIVVGRALVGGKPVAYTKLRSTYMHEVDSALGFSDFNNPDRMRNAADFQRAASKIGYTFNWLYVDDKDVAYFNSGNNPVRAKGTTGQLPMASTKEWRGFDPERMTASFTPFDQHPQVINQDVITSWNNRQAPGYAGGDNNLFSAVFRSQMLDQEIQARLAGGKKLTLPGLVDAMEEAGTTDLRGEKVLPLALQVLGTPKDPALAAAVATLRAWVANGTHRRDKDRNGVYDDHDAIRIMDAWWPRWLRAEFQPVLGEAAFKAIPHEIDNAPNNHGDHLGSAYQDGWYGYAYKDLRQVLGKRVRQRYRRTFCGNGRIAACRQALEASLKEALAVPEAELYKGDSACTAAGKPHDQPCYDAVRFRPLGAATQPLIPWINRPTYQQAIEVQGHRPR